MLQHDNVDQHGEDGVAEDLGNPAGQLGHEVGRERRPAHGEEDREADDESLGVAELSGAGAPQVGPDADSRPGHTQQDGASDRLGHGRQKAGQGAEGAHGHEDQPRQHRGIAAHHAGGGHEAGVDRIGHQRCGREK